jgi:hypothetical protein
LYSCKEESGVGGRRRAAVQQELVSRESRDFTATDRSAAPTPARPRSPRVLLGSSRQQAAPQLARRSSDDRTPSILLSRPRRQKILLGPHSWALGRRPSRLLGPEPALAIRNAYAGRCMTRGGPAHQNFLFFARPHQSLSRGEEGEGGDRGYSGGARVWGR